MACSAPCLFSAKHELKSFPLPALHFSTIRRSNDAIVAALAIPSEGSAPPKLKRLYAQPFLVQFSVLMHRCLNEYWRNPGVRQKGGGGREEGHCQHCWLPG